MCTVLRRTSPGSFSARFVGSEVRRFWSGQPGPVFVLTARVASYELPESRAISVQERHTPDF
jgi:hypothetical protein